LADFLIPPDVRVGPFPLRLLRGTFSNSLGFVQLHDSSIVNRENNRAITNAPQRQRDFPQEFAFAAG
jgi:hypothetical protein